jgi:hypothetical protein
MRATLIGLFDRYADAESAVEDLEIAGIAGGEVEVISDVDRDVRAEDLGYRPPHGVRERIGRVFDRLRGREGTVHDESGEQPEYIGEQEFYATHLMKEGAVMVVRVPSEALAGVAQEILKEHGSRTRDGKSGALKLTEDQGPKSRTAQGGS